MNEVIFDSALGAVAALALLILNDIRMRVKHLDGTIQKTVERVARIEGQLDTLCKGSE